MAKILLVEDDANLREIFEMRLQAEGYDTVIAGDGEEGMTVAVREKPDLIISDVMMPKISGFEMVENLRAVPEMKNTKVIMMTALGQAEDQTRGDKLGVIKYLVKSQVTLEDFARVVHEVLGDAGSAPASTPNTTSESGPSTSNKQESEGNMPDDATNPTPTNPAAPSSTPPADAGAAPATNPISGDASAPTDQQTSSQEQGAVNDQINSFVSGAPAGAPDMPAAPAADAAVPAPAGDASASAADTTGPTAPAATDTPAAPAPAPTDGTMPPTDTGAAPTPPADPTANAI